MPNLIKIFNISCNYGALVQHIIALSQAYSINYQNITNYEIT